MRLTVKLMSKGGGTKVPFAVVCPGPRANKSVMALTQGKPVAAAIGLPGPDL